MTKSWDGRIRQKGGEYGIFLGNNANKGISAMRKIIGFVKRILLAGSILTAGLGSSPAEAQSKDFYFP